MSGDKPGVSESPVWRFASTPYLKFSGEINNLSKAYKYVLFISVFSHVSIRIVIAIHATKAEASKYEVIINAFAHYLECTEDMPNPVGILPSKLSDAEQAIISSIKRAKLFIFLGLTHYTYAL
ncbi:MAG: hypothetical protein V7K48_31500 [Nostoc sp.]|uniref:hypothetical protein n=1 Tax=Nostoc sp. TaxID=1180 RepID=UPI002FFC6102